MVGLTIVVVFRRVAQHLGRIGDDEFIVSFLPFIGEIVEKKR